MNADTQQALAAIIGGVGAQALNQGQIATISGDGAIDVSVNGPDTIKLTKGSAAAITIAAPPTGSGGLRRTIISDSAFAHVITFTGNTLRGGTAAVATATAAAQKGAGLTVVSLQPDEAAWGVVANVAMTLA